MTSRLSRRARNGLAAVLAVAAVAALLATVGRHLLRRPPDLAEAGRLAKAGRFDQAATLVDEFLGEHPGNARARLFAAELALDRPDPRPREALRHLGLVGRAEPPRVLAVAKLDEGRAAYLLGHYARAESCWLLALRLDPRIPEAAWALLDLYYIEGRADDARRLALKQHGIEPDPHDRVHLLLELVRQDAEPPEPASVVRRLTPVVRENPQETRAALALALAQVRQSEPDAGLAALRGLVTQNPDDPAAWDALLTGLDDAGRPAELAGELAKVPASLADDPGLLRHRGRAAREKQDWPAAVRYYRQAWEARPDDLASAYRLGLLLRASGDVQQAIPVEHWSRAAEEAREEVPALYKEADGVKDFGATPYLGLYRRLAANRERLGRRDEARAWHRLILAAVPDDLESRAALARLK